MTTNKIHFDNLPKDLQEIIGNLGCGLYKTVYYSEYNNPNDWFWIIDGDEDDRDAFMQFTFKLNGKYYSSKHTRTSGNWGIPFDFEFEKEFPEIFPNKENAQVSQEYLSLLTEKKELQQAYAILESKYYQIKETLDNLNIKIKGNTVYIGSDNN